MAKARTTETIEEPIKSDRPSQRSILPLEQRFAAYGDDSSDEEREEEVYNTPITVRKHSGAMLTISHHKTTPLNSDHKQLIQNIIDYLNQDKLLTTAKKQIKVKEAIKKLEKYDSPIKDITKGFIEATGRKTIKQLEENLTQETLKHPYYNTNATNDHLHLDLNASLMMQNLGIRLLSSNKVRELYFPNKPTKLGAFTNLPTDERITTLLQETVKKALIHEQLTRHPISISDLQD